MDNLVYSRKLVDYGDFDWYSIDNIQIDVIGCCICDAPPSQTKGGRRGFLNLFKDKLVKDSIILFDQTWATPQWIG